MKPNTTSGSLLKQPDKLESVKLLGVNHHEGLEVHEERIKFATENAKQQPGL